MEKFKYSNDPQNLLVKSCVALVYIYSSCVFQVIRFMELFNIGFSYKHYNFSRICQLVKMVSKTVTRSIAFPLL